MRQLWVEKGMRELSSQRLAVKVRNIKSKKILPGAEREEVMTYVSDELLNVTPLQSYTDDIGDTPNVEVEDNEIKVRTAGHEVRQEEELGVENEAAHVAEAILNV